MKIALNALAFAPGRMGGVETYFRNLVRSLQQVDTVNDYYVVCNRQHLESLSISSPRFTPLPSRFAKPSPLWYLRVALRGTTGFDAVRPVMDRLDVDIIHHPFSILQPLNHRVPSVLTFHDMQHEFLPEYFSAYALQARKKLWRPSAEKATRIIAISGYAKTCLVDRYGIAPDKIDVVHTGYNPHFRPLDDCEPLASASSRLGLQKPFIYYPAATWPHKNHHRLLAAVKIMKERYGFDGQLVLSGIARQADGDVLQEIARLGLRDDVVVLGYLPQEDLPCLYNLARLLVFPSLYEGFGIPLLESMACGCPVACANAASIPEVVGDAAVTFDPGSVEEMAGKIWSLWGDDSLRQDLRAKGLERCTQFSWVNMARQTMGVYEKARQ
jgi:glycosyltransferase involved in cell wall biosynthesis